MNWRYIFLISFIVIVLFVLFFVKSELSLDVKQLRFSMYKYQKYDEFRQKAGEDFEREWNAAHPDDPVDVIYEPIGGTYATKINTEIVANTLQDIFVAGAAFRQYARKEILLDLTPYIDKYNDWDEINRLYPELVKFHTIDGKIYGLPNNLGAEVLYYNKTLFDRAGVPYPDAAWTWEDMRDAAIKLTKRDAQGRPLQYGLIWNYHPGINTIMNGGKVLNDARDRYVINNQEALAAANFYYDLLNTYKVLPQIGMSKNADAVTTFTNNRAAMVIGGRSYTATFKDFRDVDWAVAALPRSISGTRKTPMNFNTLAIDAKTLHPDLAYKLLRYLSGPDQVRKLVEMGDSIPVEKGEEANQYFLDEPGRPAGENRAYFQSMEDGLFTENNYSSYLIAREEGSEILSKYRNRFLRGDISAEAMLKGIESESNALVLKALTEVKRTPIAPFIISLVVFIIVPAVAAFLLWLHFKGRAEMKKSAAISGRRTSAGYLFLMPNFIGFLLFVLMPVMFSLILSFCEWDLLTWPPRFVGFGNFSMLLTDVENFWQLVFNTVVLMLGIPVGIALSLFLALVLNRKIRGRNFYRALFFLPSFAGGVALLILWKFIYDTDFGLLNMAITKFGNLFGASWSGIQWLDGSPFITFFKYFKLGMTKPALIIMARWTSMGGYTMIIYLAALQGINPELYEASAIDGASRWQQFKNITWPLLSPATFFILIMGVIRGFQGGFQAAYILTQGGPDMATTTIGYGIYNNAFVFYHMGKAAAISWILFLMVFIFTLINWRFGGKKVNY